LKIVIDPLFLRRPKINYISPAVCEAVFSGTGSPIIILSDISKLPGPTGLAFGGVGSRRFTWNRYPGALCYNVYTAVFNVHDIFSCQQLVSESSTVSYQIIAECIVDPVFVIPSAGCYRVSAITPDGESDLSDPACVCDFTPPTITVCNDEQTATCTPPQVGPPVTIAAGTFCVDTVPEDEDDAKAQMNAQAMQQAQAELVCGGGGGGCANFGTPSGVITEPPSAGTTNIVVNGPDFDWTINIPGGSTGGQALVTHPVHTSVDCNCLLKLNVSTYPSEASSIFIVLKNDGAVIGVVSAPNFPFDPVETFPFTIPAGTTNLTLELNESSGFAPVNETWHGNLSFA